MVDSRAIFDETVSCLCGGRFRPSGCMLRWGERAGRIALYGALLMCESCAHRGWYGTRNRVVRSFGTRE